MVARVVSNGSNGSVGGLSNGAQSIPWSQIVPASVGSLPHPAIGNGAVGVPSALAAVSGLVDRSSTWSFSYSNSNPLGAGNYSGQVIYTAALP